jgi:Holliday junction resolvase RusA-like endonuclease
VAERWETFVVGTVRPQGSLSLWKGPDGTERARYADTTVRWRQLLHGELSRWWGRRPALAVPVGIELVCYFARPKSHFGTGRNAGALKPSAPEHHTTYPDLDKSQRAVGDGLVDAGVLVDDCWISEWWARKMWCPPDRKPGAAIAVEVLP